MGGKRLYRKYDKKTGELIELECGKCHEIKTVDCFNKDKSKKDGVNTKCKRCENERGRQWHENNPDYDCQRYKNNKDKINEKQCQYYENNKDKICEKQRQYNKNNKDKINEKQRQWYENKIQQEMMEIYENVTKHKYPNNGIQYGVVYGAYCKASKKWYIGQTTNSFNVRYEGNFFKYKCNELYEDNTKRQLLAEDIEKYGQENFEIFEVIDVAFSEKELDEKEAYYIDYYKAYYEGYNSNRGNIFKHGKEKKKCCCE